jgi:Zn-dependent protease
MEKLSGWKLFTVRGVAVKIHMSLLFILLYILIVASSSFPFIVKASGINPEEITGSSLDWAFTFSISLIVSIFLHEFSHVLMAQSKGFKVRGITLMMLGGISQMEEIPEDPGTELQIAIIGPLVSLAIAGILFWVRSRTTSTNLSLFCFWLGQTNLVLAIFNFLPAFPTDGGRILRSILVPKWGRLRGTQIAVQVSQIFAWIFGIIGFLQFNLLLILIAFFIYSASKGELFILWGQTLLKGMSAKDVMRIVYPIEAQATLREAVFRMNRSRQLILPVSGDQNKSVISYEVINQIPKHLWKDTLVRDVAVQIPKVIDINDPLDEIWPIALSTIVGGIPVTQDHQIIGIIKKVDLMEVFELKRLTTETKSPVLNPWFMKFHYQR